MSSESMDMTEMSPITFDPLLVDARHNSCRLDGPWLRRAKEDLRYNRILAKLERQQLKWKYDQSDCQCMSALGEETHDPSYECKICGKCCADEPTLSDRNDSYEDKGYCIPCIMELEELSIEEIAWIIDH
jgi:hypothetical protein